MKIKIPKSQLICFILIIIICIIAIFEAVYYVLNPTSLEGAKKEEEHKKAAQQATAKDFDDIFQNNFVNTINSGDIEKIDNTQDYIYTSYEKEEESPGQYDINVNIPTININSEEIKSYNDEIKAIFEDKAESILNGGSNNSVYSVDYQAYLNEDILSIIIKSTLKEGDNPQRVIVQTYCYNTREMRKVEFDEIMQLKNLDKNNVSETIKTQIQGKQEEARALQQLGYSAYLRDLRSDRYEVENIDNFFIDETNHIYVIYAYGNAELTDVTDVVIF